MTLYNEAQECVNALVALETGGSSPLDAPPSLGNFEDIGRTTIEATVSRQTQKPKKKKSRKNKKNKPKKAMTPFMVFSKETRSILVQEKPNMTFSEIGKELGARWRSLADNDKVEYVEKAKQDYLRFLAESEQMDAQFYSGKRKKTTEQKNQTKKKKSISAYLYFCNAHREQVKACHPEMKMVEIQRLLAEKWKNSSSTLKLPFEKQAEADRQKYNNEIKKNEANISFDAKNLQFNNPIPEAAVDLSILQSQGLVSAVKEEQHSIKQETPINFLHE